jgi:ABC-type bacteriocin/lantibiotic exporter with double-glycine peptidase domain
MLACLRMLLAENGKEVTEATLVEQIGSPQGGIDPDQLAALARRHGLKAEALQIDLERIIELVHAELFPILVIDRSLLDREFAIHAVIPFRFSRHFVNVLDPLHGERRISRRKLVQAHRRVGRWALVWQSHRAAR